MKIKRMAQLGSALLLSTSSLLILNIGGALAIANNCTWTGAIDDNFNNSGNWSSCNSTVPQTGDNLIFDTNILGSNTGLNNDIVGLSVGSITFQGAAAFYGYDISGNSFTLAGGIVNNSNSLNTFSNNITITGSQSLDLSGGDIELSGNLDGAGNLSISGPNVLFLAGDNSSYSGNINITSGEVWPESGTALGDSTGTTTVQSGALLFFSLTSSATVSEPITIGGVGDGLGFNNFAIGAYTLGNQTLTLSGNIVLSADTTVGPGTYGTDSMIITGGLSGAHTLTVAQGQPGKLTISSSANTSQTANGTYQAPKVTMTYSDSQPAQPVSVNFNETVVITGTRQSISVNEGGTLKGTGTVADVFVDSLATIAPGLSPGCLNTGNLTLNGTYDAEIGGTTACSGYDQLNVTGTVDVTGATLNTTLYNDYKPKAGEAYTIIKNDSNDAITGTFTGLAEGATFKVNGYVFKISYVGGDGNDTVLSVVSVPAVPDTGFAKIAASTGASAAVATLAAGTIILIARRIKFTSLSSRK